MLVPLIGLGSDQVEKVFVVKPTVEAYHISKDKHQDVKNLRNYLLNMSSNEVSHTSVLPFSTSLNRTPGKLVEIYLFTVTKNQST